MKKTVAIVLILCMMLSLFSMTTFAVQTIAGDVNADGKVTPYDALLVQAHLHGEITLTEDQIARAIAACEDVTTLSTAHIVAIFFKPLQGQNAQAPEADGLYHITSVADMALLRSFPYAGFSLDADIDMSGVAWTPFVFNGVLLGNGHTISNLNVAPSNNNLNAGALFLKLGSANNTTAQVENLTLESPTLTTTTSHKYAGLVAGTNYGTIQTVNLTDATITGAINAENAVGAEAGMNYGTVGAAQAEFDITYACANNDYIGQNAAGGNVTYNESYSITKNGQTEIAIEKFTDTSVSRQAVVDYMAAMADINWKYPYETVTYRDTTNSAVGDYEVKKDRNYYGMKYGHEAASLEAMLDEMRYNGSIYVVNRRFDSYSYADKTTWNTELDGKLVMGHYFSNDCASSIGWAWSLVSGSYTGERTTRMAPTAYNIANWGILKVGNYDMSRSEAQGGHRTVWYTGDSYNNPKIRSILTDDQGVLDEANLTALYEAYALLQPGDAIVQNDRYYKSDNTVSTDGHSKLVESVTVVRNADGTIDPVKSKIHTIECGGGGSTKYEKNPAYPQYPYYSQWRYNHYNFKTYAGFKNDYSTSLDDSTRYRIYVPVTIRELADGSRPASYIQLKNSQTPLSGIVSSNYRIVWTSVTIDGVTDKSYTGTQPLGTTFDNPYEGLDESGFTSAAKLNSISTAKHEASRMVYKSVNLEKHAAAFANLPSGTHSYEITVKIGTGETATFSGTFTNTDTNTD